MGTIKHRLQDLTPPVVLRLRFIECMLVHYDSFNQHLLCDYFGIASAQATRDVEQYKALAPDNLEYWGAIRQYVRGKFFKTLWPTESKESL